MSAKVKYVEDDGLICSICSPISKEVEVVKSDARFGTICSSEAVFGVHCSSRLVSIRRVNNVKSGDSPRSERL
jgi:hypothetical protein